MHIPFLWPGAKYNTRSKLPLTALNGQPLGEMDNVPAILVPKIAEELKLRPAQEIQEICDVMKRAADLFANGVVDGESPADYVKKAHLISGTPMQTLEEALKDLSHVMTISESYVSHAIPDGVRIFSAGAGIMERGVYWVPKGKILSCIAPGNNPVVHKAWLEALAAGYKVLLRPSLKEPFTPYRMVKCLLEAGLSPDMLAFVPGDHSIVNEIVDAGDVVLLFGDRNVVEKYKKNERVIVRGPGYSKVFWDAAAGVDKLDAVETVVRSIADDGGMKCTNASGLVLAREHVGSLDAIADALGAYGTNGLLDPQGAVPVMAIDVAVRIRDYLQQQMKQADVAWSNRELDDLLIDFGDGTAALAPLIFLVNQIKEEMLNLELPFACSWAYVPEERNLLHVLKHSLALTAMSENQQIIKQLIGDPTIKKVVVGNKPTWMTYDKIPHDGYLAEQLFITKGVI